MGWTEVYGNSTREINCILSKGPDSLSSKYKLALLELDTSGQSYS